MKKIIEVLRTAESGYLESFEKLTKIEDAFEEANDNLQYLSLLSTPCKKIENADPKNIPEILPDVLRTVRLIWNESAHYNTVDRIKSLLTKISNQIIQRCKAKIKKEDMLDGDVEKCMSDLDESIACCEQWTQAL